MNFFKTGLQSVLGTNESNESTSSAETIERLVDRVQSSTLLEDRRDACRALKALSKKYRLEVGAQAMMCLAQVLESDRSDCEIVGYCLDTLCNITSPEQFEEEADNELVSANIGEQFTEMFIKNTENIGLVLSHLEEYDFRVRWSSIKLLTCLLANRAKEIQEVVLVSPMGVSRLMDLLVDSREIIRNDALLLLIQLTKGNANIQKIVAFENAFDKLFDVINEEGCSDGGIVVEDCLILMLNLMKNNTSNQQFFKEGSYIQRIAPMFVLGPEVEETGMTPQKVSNLHCMLQIIRVLVSPNNSQQTSAPCKKIMRGCGLLETLCKMLMSSGIPPDILTETINTCAEIIRGDANNQAYFNDVMAPSNPPRPALVVLLMSMVNEKQPLALRCAVLYCFESYLYKNESGQNHLISTLLPSTRDAPATLTSGQLLCGGLFSTDVLSNWFSAVALLYALIDNNGQKEQLLRSLLATSSGSTPISLLHQCFNLLQQGQYKHQSKIGILMFLSMWLANCETSVKSFLAINGAISFLIAQITANEHDENEYLIQGLCAFLMGICIQFNDNSVDGNRKDDLCQLLIKRIGLETFSGKLSEVSKHESYSKAGKQPQIRVKQASDLLLDYEFCRLFKTLEASILKVITNFSNGNESINELTLSQEASSLVAQYKNIIREQDGKLQSLNEKLREFEQKNEILTSKLSETMTSMSHINDQNILLKAQLSAAGAVGGGAVNTQITPSDENRFQVDQLQNQIQMLMNENSHQKTKINFYESENSRLLNEIEEMKAVDNNVNIIKSENSELSSKIQSMTKDQEDLLELLADQELKLKQYRRKLRELGQQVEASDDDEN
ncbi:CLUMA_CG007651, isoform A [Clunio marinus]|uniref:CLUMA_CG007651, isoform A n=1 Tax=Clunio marinus TaxID=568069 RepID=A0A1J1I1P1_9DIPT|nr:CLUMA_CG007651, isoform A [Clunio marinus]